MVRGLAAVRRGELEAAAEILGAMRGASVWEELAEEATEGETLASCCAPASAVDDLVQEPGRRAAEVMTRELAGVLELARGHEGEGLALLADAAELEDGLGFDFGPPTVPLPAHELYGQALLEAGQAAAAVAQFEAALRRAPRRATSLLGLVRAARAAGDLERAREAHAELAAVWHGADPAVRERLAACAP